MMYKNNFVAVIKCNGKILRERNGEDVYLPFGAEYSILLKNKDARRAVVEIEVDGKNVLDGQKLIVNGNETQEIKGFMRNMSKTNRFRFIQKTREIQRHRGDRLDDGLVRVTYQFEKAQPEPIHIYYYDNSPKWGSGSDWIGGSFTYSNSNDMIKSSTRSMSFGKAKSYCSSAPNVDEGVTVKGTMIDQEFTYGSMGELETAVYTIVLHLRGITKHKKVVKKPVTVRTKFKCETCGRKNKSSNKFCYNCGSYLD